MSGDFVPEKGARFRARGGRLVHVVCKVTPDSKYSRAVAYCGAYAYSDATTEVDGRPECNRCQREQEAAGSTS